MALALVVLAEGHRNVPALVVSTVLGVVVFVLLLWRRRQAATSRGARRARDRE